jgi:outer membrane protein
MKNLLIVFTFFIFQTNFLLAETNIAFIDMDKVISTSKPGLSLMKQLNEINEKNKKKFQDDTKNLKTKETKLISQKNILSENDFQLKVNELQKDIKLFNDNRNKIINDFNKLKIESTNKLLKIINPELIKYSDEKSISVILQKKNLIIGKNELDITNEIIKIINSNVKEFKIK